MPRETSTLIALQSPTAPVSPRKQLHDLLELVRRTPGFEVQDAGNNYTWRVFGGSQPLSVSQNSEDIPAVERALAGVGWSRSAAEQHIAMLEEMYSQAYAKIPSGGYPKEDRYITREEARQKLKWASECGCNSRPPKPGKIREYAEAMDRGEWQPYSPQGLIFSAEHGCLLDGRQRMIAMLRSGLAGMGFTVILNVPIDQFRYLDQGANRSIADILAGDGVLPGVRSRAHPAIRLIRGYDSGLPWKQWEKIRFSKPQISALLAGEFAELKGKAYNDALSLAGDKKVPGCRMSIPVGMALSYLIRRDYPDSIRWEQFRTALAQGTDLSSGDPRLVLRDQLIKRKPGVQHRYEVYRQFGAALLAWAYWNNDESVGQLPFKENMDMPRIWVPGMPLPGTDPKRLAQQRVQRRAKNTPAPPGADGEG
jgi:hypothetical protein